VVRTEIDRQEILNHIRSIFEAYVRQDRATIRATHSEDWTGFQGPSTRIERGIADYMVNAEHSLRNLQGVGYEILDTEVQLNGDLGIVYYVARFDYRDRDGNAASLPLRSLDVYRREKSGWIQCGSHITPVPHGGVWGAK
jgi:ketosteroid isomerase-like protein